MAIARKIYNGELPDEYIDAEMTGKVAKQLRNAIIEGFGKDFPDIDFDTPDARMLENLENNIWRFSAAKNYQQMKDMGKALIGEDGKVRPFKEFKDIANKISFQYNNNWLLTEYNTAISSSQMASSWVEYENNAYSQPYLQYVTAGDDRVREEHAALDGIVRAIDDPFWDTYYPPNGFNCRCDVIQLPGDHQESDLQERTLPDLPEMFKTNLAKNGQVFPEDHPYFDGVPKNAFEKAIKKSRNDG